MSGFWIGLIAIGILIGGVVLTSIGEIFTAAPGGGWKISWWGALWELLGLVLTILAVTTLIGLTVNLSRISYLKSYVSDMPMGVAPAVQNFTVDTKTGTAKWTIRNPNQVIWVTLTSDPQSGSDRHTWVFSPWEVSKTGNDGKVYFEYTDQSLINSKSASVWYATEAGPSPLATFPAVVEQPDPKVNPVPATVLVTPTPTSTATKK